MAVQRIDRLISSIISNQLDQEIGTLMNTVTDLIENGDVVTDEDREDAAMRFIFYLENQEMEWRSQSQTDERLAPAYRTLKMMMHRKDMEMKLLKSYLRTKINETKEGKKDEEFRDWLSQHRERFLPESSTARQREVANPPKWALATIGYALQWVIRQAAEYISVLKLPLGSTLDEAIGYLTNGGILSTVGVSAAYVGCVSIYNLLLVAFGKRSWTRAKKEIIDDGGSVLTGNLIGLGVAAGIGTFVSLPAWGLFVVSAGVGWFMSWVARKCLSEWTFEWFNLPRDERLEKAYNLLGVKHTDSNSVVNRAYRIKSRQFHPDTLGKREPIPSEREVGKALQTFIKIQDALDLIRKAREENGLMGHGENQREEEEISWRMKVMLLIQKLNPLRRGADTRANDPLTITYEFPPVIIFDDSTVETEDDAVLD